MNVVLLIFPFVNVAFSLSTLWYPLRCPRPTIVPATCACHSTIIRDGHRHHSATVPADHYIRPPPCPAVSSPRPPMPADHQPGSANVPANPPLCSTTRPPRHRSGSAIVSANPPSSSATGSTSDQPGSGSGLPGRGSPAEVGGTRAVTHLTSRIDENGQHRQYRASGQGTD